MIPAPRSYCMQACSEGADVIGGCPYSDTEPIEHIARVFAIARRFDLDIDFHLDFDLDANWMHLDEVTRQTRLAGYGGRVAVGHVSKLSALPSQRQIEIAHQLAEAGVAVTVLPATDLFLLGRDSDYNVPRGVTRADRLAQHGVTCSLASNNILNAFTPFGDASLLRMANLYANVAQLGRQQDFARCFDMITAAAARLMRLDGYGLAVGSYADLLVLPCRSPVAAVTELCQPSLRVQAGSQELYPPAEPAPHTLSAAAGCGAGTPLQPAIAATQTSSSKTLGKVAKEPMNGRSGGMAADVDANTHLARAAPIPRKKALALIALPMGKLAGNRMVGSRIIYG